ncbi:hypothetical protein [Piscinibacter sp. XHJ-5]|uniref:hypothetical protein n=1 Tax=Piscinibacter sp. XHJ-5 TaxID=3037797 RepID=UPI002452C65D|nr:hypothetical protein [Piscinibacter sp. XHJ-5]
MRVASLHPLRLRQRRAPDETLLAATLQRIASEARRLMAGRCDPRTRYLSAACDHDDLERRMRAYDEERVVVTTPWPSL